MDPRFSFAFRNVVGAIDESADVWTLLHDGVEIKILNLLILRGGINHGYLTLGGGLDLPFIDMNIAVFTQELGAHLGDQPCAGMTADANVRI